MGPAVCQLYLKMLDLTALLTKDTIEPLHLPGLLTGGANAPGQPPCRSCAGRSLCMQSAALHFDVPVLEEDGGAGYRRREGRHRLPRMA